MERNPSDLKEQKRNKISDKLLAVGGALALAASLSACGPKEAGADNQTPETTTSFEENTPEPPMNPTDTQTIGLEVDSSDHIEASGSGSEVVPSIESADEQFEAWLGTLSQEQLDFYNKMTPEYIATLSPDEITEVFRVPISEVINADGEIDPKKAAVSFLMRAGMGSTIASDPELLAKEGIDASTMDLSEFDEVAEEYEQAWDEGFLANPDSSHPSGVTIMRDSIIRELQDLYPGEDIENYYTMNFVLEFGDVVVDPVDTDVHTIKLTVQTRDNYSKAIKEKLGGDALQVNETYDTELSMRADEDGFVYFKSYVIE